MDKFAKLVGRQYHLFDYVGAPDAERVIVMMGSGAEAAQEAVEYLTARGREGGRLEGPPLPALLDRALRAGPAQDGQDHRRARPHQGAGRRGRAAVPGRGHGARRGRGGRRAPFAAIPRVIGGRYGLSSKEFTPAMVKAVFDELAKAEPKNHFTVGINDDVTHTSLECDPHFSTEIAEDGARPLLRPGRRRHGGRQQELDQDHRRGHRQLRPGLLRVRLEEVGRGDHLAPALRPASPSIPPT